MENTQVLLNIVWTMVGAFLVYFMQAGFAMVETGFTRAKNSGNILMKNMMDFVLGSIFFFIIGFALMFGGSNAFIGTAGFFHPKSLADADGMFNGLPIGVFMIFQTVFCATSATIVSGAMAERTKFISYLIYSAAISVFIYPITGHWIWGGGWLSQIGFHDFAGSTAVHMVGGLCALAGAKMVGPRIGKYTKEGKPVAIPGHNLPLGALGVFILWFCWFGFNCGSTTAATYNLGDIAMTTNLAAAAATLVTLIVTWVRYGKPDISMTMNGALAGLVAITASCDVVNDYEALFIGAVAGVVVVFAVEFFDKVVKIDDPVGNQCTRCLWSTRNLIYRYFRRGMQLYHPADRFCSSCGIYPDPGVHSVLRPEKDHRTSRNREGRDRRTGYARARMQRLCKLPLPQ